MEPNVKFVSAIKDAFFNKKNGGKFFSREKDQTGGWGGSEGGFGKRPYFSRDFFLEPFPYWSTATTPLGNDTNNIIEVIFFLSHSQAVTLPFFTGSSISPLSPIPISGKYFYYASYSPKLKLTSEHQGVQLVQLRRPLSHWQSWPPGQMWLTRQRRQL